MERNVLKLLSKSYRNTKSKKGSRTREYIQELTDWAMVGLWIDIKTPSQYKDVHLPNSSAQRWKMYYRRNKIYFSKTKMVEKFPESQICEKGAVNLLHQGKNYGMKK